MKIYSFDKKERLFLKKDIDFLFLNNTNFSIYPFKILYRYADNQDDNIVKVLISIPKKNIKKAVDRNLLKRRVKEAYRKNKIQLHETLSNNNKKIQIAIIYVGKEIIDFAVIENKILLTLQRLILDCEKST